MKRRCVLAGPAALPALPALSMSAALARPSGSVAQTATVRIIVDNDFAGDPDGLVALAHQLLSARTRTVLVTSSALDPGLARMAGLDTAATAAALAIVAEALREDPLPLVVATAFDPAACPATQRQVRRLLDEGRYGDRVEARQVRLAHSLDARLNWADFLALVRAHARGRSGRAD